MCTMVYDMMSGGPLSSLPAQGSHSLSLLHVTCLESGAHKITAVASTVSQLTLDSYSDRSMLRGRGKALVMEICSSKDL